MKQISLTTTGFELNAKPARKHVFPEEMNHVAPWADLVALITPHAPASKTGHLSFADSSTLRNRFLQPWLSQSDWSIEKTVHDVSQRRQFADFDARLTQLPDESTVSSFWLFLKGHNLSARLLGTINDILTARGLLLKNRSRLDPMLIAAPSSTNHQSGERHLEVHQKKKGNHLYFDIKANVGVAADSGLVCAVAATAQNPKDAMQVHSLLHSEDAVMLNEADYQVWAKRPEATGVARQIAMHPSKRRALPDTPWNHPGEKIENVKPAIRAKVHDSFWVIKRKFGLIKLRYRFLRKSTAQLLTFFALYNLRMVQKTLKEE